MDTLERFPAPWHIVPRRDGKLSNVYCGGTPIALCVPDDLSHTVAAAPAMLAALKYARRYCNSEAYQRVQAAIASAEGR